MNNNQQHLTLGQELSIFMLRTKGGWLILRALVYALLYFTVLFSTGDPVKSGAFYAVIVSGREMIAGEYNGLHHGFNIYLGLATVRLIVFIAVSALLVELLLR